MLSDAWSRAVSGDPGLVVVTGPGGIGKSALLSALTAVVESDRRRRARRALPCVRALAAAPAGGRRAAVDADRPGARRAGGHARGHVDEWLGLLPELAAVFPAAARPGAPRTAGRPAQAERRAVFEAVAHVLDRLGRSRPVLLLLDDLQDAGLATVELLDHLPRRLAAVRARVLIAAASRTGEGSAAAALAGDDDHGSSPWTGCRPRPCRRWPRPPGRPGGPPT